MPILRFTRLAERDLAGIAAYTLRTWGAPQTMEYLDEMEACCRRLAENPLLGRGCEDIRAGLRRMEVGSHVLFYRKLPEGVLVVRILHQRMLPERPRLES